MRYGRTVGNIIIEVFEGDLENSFHPTIANQFEEIPNDVDTGWTLNGDDWEAPIIEADLPPLIEETPKVIKITPSEFMLLFTSPERLNLKSLRSGDVVLNDFFDLLEDPRLTSVDLSRESTISALTYCHSLLVTGNIIAAEIKDQRLVQILSGTIL